MGLTHWEADFTLLSDGKDVTEAIRRGVNEIRFTDNGAATKQTDSLDITLYSEVLALPPKGVTLSLSLGFNGNMVNKGQFTVCQVKSSGPPRKIQITATAAPMNNARHGYDATSTRNRTFEDKTLGDILERVAADNGLTGRISASLVNIKVPSVIQLAESDLSMMSRLASQYGAVSKPSNGFWLFLEYGAAQASDGGFLPDITITPDMVSDWSYQEGDRGSDSANSSGKGKGKDDDKKWKVSKPTSDDTSGSIRTKYYNESTGEIETYTVQHDGPDIDNPHTSADKESAKGSADTKAKKVKKAGKKMTITAPCTQEMLKLTAESRITTQGFGKSEDRRWQVESIDWTLNSRGLVASFSLATDIQAAGGGKGKSGKGKKPTFTLEKGSETTH
ncbi:phage protein D [Trabulsiella guamensis ATCC 49490]|uniref:Phage protein D n=1 Tax=Trabulsiella guamensis ATCC 49490 TaxID=1005994 RepID=A0A085ARU4_9ENTR|nr:contractile injection system protein, VgrG/Pvc8 family [Trabulsiella guamensis]KFC12939.1 phage protein D [Trabulsiella guamensis ATCC 49490]